MVNFSEVELSKIYWVEKKLLPNFHEYENLLSININKTNTTNLNSKINPQIKISFTFQYNNEVYLWSEEGVFELTDKNNSLNFNIFSQLLYLNKIQVDFYVLKDNNKVFFENLKQEIIQDFPINGIENTFFQFQKHTMQDQILSFYGKELTNKISIQYLHMYLKSDNKKKSSIIKI